MINETYYQRKEREADEFLAALLSLPEGQTLGSYTKALTQALPSQ